MLANYHRSVFVRAEPVESGRGKPRDEVRSGRVSDTPSPEERKNYGSPQWQRIVEVNGVRLLVDDNR
jgi:hypothetical protein